MTHQNIKNKTAVIFHHLVGKQLKDAFDALHQLITEYKLITYQNTLEELQTTYKYMLQYTAASANDPERQKVYDKLFVDTYHLCDQLEQHLLGLHSNKYPYSSLRNKDIANINTVLKELKDISSQYDMAISGDNKTVPYSITSKYQSSVSALFNIYWASSFYSDDILDTTKDIIKGQSIKEYELAMLTSAITLSLWRNFDQHKFDILFDLTNYKSEMVRQRAYVGIIIAIYTYSERIAVFSNIKARFTILSENKTFVKAIENIIIQFIRSKESEKIAKRFTEEIIPEMIKISPQMRDKLNFSKSDTGMDGDEDKNPDWQELFDEVPGLTDKMKEISEMQMEGADVFLSTFSMLKVFPFFNHLHNWTVPFSTDYPEVVSEVHNNENKPFIDAIEKSRFLCNSDKYSFILSMQQLPPDQKHQMASSIGAEFEGMKEVEKDATSLNKDKKAEYISNQYIQDLYRLFNLHPRKTDFENIFDDRLDFHNKPIIAELVEDNKLWRNIAEYYFAKNYFEEASELFDVLLKEDSTNQEILQKRGYCAQKLSHFEQALDFYLKADLVESNKSWTIKKIAFCYRALNNTEKALEYYQQAIALQPKNMSLQLSAGHCYLSLKNYNEALNTYFKIELESKNAQKAWRPIAWCSFISNKLEQSVRYYEKIIAAKPTAHDFINAGHAQLATHNNQQAVDYYKLAVKALDNNIEKFLSIFKDDREYILNYDVDKNDLPILLDKLRYDLE